MIALSGERGPAGLPSPGELTEAWVAQLRGDTLAQWPGYRRQTGEQLDELEPAVLSFAGGGPLIDRPVDQLPRSGQCAFRVRVHPPGADRPGVDVGRVPRIGQIEHRSLVLDAAIHARRWGFGQGRQKLDPFTAVEEPRGRRLGTIRRVPRRRAA